MKLLANSFLFVLAIATTPLIWAQHPLGSNLKIKIEATELDQETLLARLNANGSAHHLHFVLADRNFDYRVTFGTEQKPVSGINASAATTAVYDAEGIQAHIGQRNAEGLGIVFAASRTPVAMAEPQ